MVSWRGPRRIIRQEHADRPGDGCQGWSGARWTRGRGDRPAGSEVGERHRPGVGGATRRGDRGGALRQLPGSGQSGGVPRHVRLDGELRNADREDEGGGGRTHSTGWSPGRPAASAGGRGGWSRRVVAGWAAEA